MTFRYARHWLMPRLRKFHAGRSGRLGILALSFPSAAFSAWPASADPDSPSPSLPPGVTVAVRGTVDIFDVPAGSDPGTAILDKIQISATLRGDRIGLPGWQIHAQAIRIGGQSLSARLGDLQTADNIEAPHAFRLFEAYLARMVGPSDHQVALRLGMIDLNSQFDSIDTAALMINSSHGIGPDLSKSGLDGPSIYPVTAIGSTATWTASKAVAVRFGIFDGVSGSPSSPHAFLAERLKPRDGILAISQLDWFPTKTSRVEAGAWSYTAAWSVSSGPKAHDRGAYISFEAPFTLLSDTRFWVRAGVASARAQTVDAYFGGGLVRSGLIRGRKDDRIGIAVAHAIISPRFADTVGTYRAETSVELTYQAKLSRRFVIQPDFDFIRDPSGAPHAKDSLGIGLRLVFATSAPSRMEASDPGDPTIPPDGAPAVEAN